MNRPLTYRLKQWLERLHSWWRPFDLITVEGDLPDKILSRTVYVVTDDGTPWQACLSCPLGCGHVVQLNLVEGIRPLWRFTNHGGRPTLAPSVWRTDDCRCHYFLRHGRIHWCD